MNNNTKNLVRVGHVSTIYNVNQTKVLKYQVEMTHNGLNEHKVISAPELYILQNKIDVQTEKWNEHWNLMCEKKQKEDDKMQASNEASERGLDAKERVMEIENILLECLNNSNVVNWEEMKDKELFSEPEPEKPRIPSYMNSLNVPDRNAIEFQSKSNLLTTLFKSFQEKAIQQSDMIYEIAVNEWQRKCYEITQSNKKSESKYKNEIEDYNKNLSEWNEHKLSYIENQNQINYEIENLKNQYMEYDMEAIVKHNEIVLKNSRLPVMFAKNFELNYNPKNKIIIIDYLLPSYDDFPKINEVKYISSKNEIKETYFNDNYIGTLFDTTIYKLVLRILHEVFQADIINAIDAISLNGWSHFLNKATGKFEDACIVTIMVRKEEFVNIDLRNVEPKVCFKSLKGIGSSKLAGITPVNPILSLNKEDKRFIASHDVTNSFDDTTNLAAIPWEEFEHLIREVFEREFSLNGGEVKVTQASRDGGVDAIAFDPDPIRGGKIVIQAKRYTNTVGVSAVRDLYGTVMNEGATKGILVTTADYGPDAYDFANNKPLTLLNGGHLLHLMEKQGHKAKIDLKEAKILNLENSL